MTTHAIILAAGRGSRMGELTTAKPKCLTELAGKTLLEHQITALRYAGLANIAVVRGYQRDKISHSGLTFFENRNWRESNMVSSLIEAAPWLENHACIVSYSDIFYAPTIPLALVKDHSDIAISYDLAWLSLWSERFDDPLSDAESFRLDERGYLSSIGKKARNLQEIEGQFMGLLHFTPEGWRQVRGYLTGLDRECISSLDMTMLLNRLLEAGIAVKAVPVEGQWGEVDQASDLAVYERLAATRGKHAPWKQTDK